MKTSFQEGSAGSVLHRHGSQHLYTFSHISPHEFRARITMLTVQKWKLKLRERKQLTKHIARNGNIKI